MARNFDRTFNPNQSEAAGKDVFVITLTSIRMFWVASSLALLLSVSFIFGYSLGDEKTLAVASDSDSTNGGDIEVHNPASNSKSPNGVQGGRYVAESGQNGNGSKFLSQSNYKNESSTHDATSTKSKDFGFNHERNADHSQSSLKSVSGKTFRDYHDDSYGSESTNGYSTGRLKLPRRGAPYYIQVATHASNRGAEFVTTIINRNSNFHAFVKETSGGKYLVRIGPYRDDRSVIKDYERLLRTIPESKLKGISTSRIKSG